MRNVESVVDYGRRNNNNNNNRIILDDDERKDMRRMTIGRPVRRVTMKKKKKKMKITMNHVVEVVAVVSGRYRPPRVPLLPSKLCYRMTLPSARPRWNQEGRHDNPLRVPYRLYPRFQ